MLKAGSCMKAAGISFLIIAMAGALAALSCRPETQRKSARTTVQVSCLGFDRNIFPDVSALPMLRKTFAFTGYWLSPPPGETTNTWTGQRKLLRTQGFGFLLLYRGPLERDLRNPTAATEKGAQDSQNALAAAQREGFPARAIIFVDIEEGGRLPETYHAYLHAWVAGLTRARYRAGAYCSGIPVKEEPGSAITTADDIRAHMGTEDFSYFIYNDACPPSPGCVFPTASPAPADGGAAYAAAWQFAQSPRRMEFAAHCPPGYHMDGNCYAPGDTAHAWFLDVSSASSPDPSNGR